MSQKHESQLPNWCGRRWAQCNIKRWRIRFTLQGHHINVWTIHPWTPLIVCSNSHSVPLEICQLFKNKLTDIFPANILDLFLIITKAINLKNNQTFKYAYYQSWREFYIAGNYIHIIKITEFMQSISLKLNFISSCTKCKQFKTPA